MWRWSLNSKGYKVTDQVFSTYVEVILFSCFRASFFWRILHVCGGDPNGTAGMSQKEVYSPRMWRWSLFFSVRQSNKIVFSTYVEVILNEQDRRIALSGILHVCGGDPEKLDNVATWIEYSPRMWGDPEEIMNVIIRDHKEKF